MLMFPINYIFITQLFKKNVHNGLDIRGKQRGIEADIISPGNGRVIEIRNNYKTQDKTGNSYGNFVRIDHGNGLQTLVAHLKYDSVVVKVGDQVRRGDKLAIMGTTGNSTGIHVHYEVFRNNVKVDPLEYTYVYPLQQVDKGSVKYVKYITYINASPRDESVNQVLINATNLSIRSGASLSNERVGFVEKDAYYNYTETKSNDNYTWYKIGDNAWIANEGTYLTVLNKKEITENIDEENESDIEEVYKFKFIVDKTATYLIDLNEGEVLYIK